MANLAFQGPLKWRSLSEAIAWTLTRDEAFCTSVANDKNTQDRIFCATDLLRQAMLSAENGHRFSGLAAAYETANKAEAIDLWDFLDRLWQDAFQFLAGRLADGDISMRGVAIDGERRLPAGDMPSACVTPAMRMDYQCVVWEGPEDQPSRGWIDITVNWDELVTCFPATIPAEPPKGECERCVTLSDRASETSVGTRQPTRTGRSGARPQYDAATFEAILDGLFKLHGPIGPLDDWNSEAQVAREMQKKFEEKYPKDDCPGWTWSREFVGRYLDRRPQYDSRGR